MRSLGMRTSSKTSSLVMLAFRLCLPFITGALKPLSPRSTMKPWMRASARVPPGGTSLAQTMARSASEPLVIHILAPLST